jgi:wyosine [tRNA(Phe)-imidazoG37] synthetase (radical SAM superfamily)
MANDEVDLNKELKAVCERVERAMSTGGDIVFGPVPSRRLGRSLGINNIKAKTCSYDCIYCQVGPTTTRSICRQQWVDPYELCCFAKKRIQMLTERGTAIDYISFVPSGEPTLDLQLSKAIRLLRTCGRRIAVFTNSSLLWNDNVKEDLLFADYVSVKIDTAVEATWNVINRPHGRLRFQSVLDGIADFSRFYRGDLTTETMIVKNVNDTVDEIGFIGEYLSGLPRRKSYFMIPVRPPAEQYAVAPDPSMLSQISEYISKTISDSEALFAPETGDFEGAGNVAEALLGILSVHPMSQDALESFIRNNGGNAETLQGMIRHKLIRATDFRGRQFYVRNQPV